MDKLIAHIDQKSRLAETSYMDQIYKEAEAMSASMLKDAKNRIEKRKKIYEKELRNEKEKALTNIKMNARNAQNQLRQELVDTIILDVKEYFKDLTKEEYLDFLEKAIEGYVKGNGKPRLVICPRYYEHVLEVYGLEYQVVSDKRLASGFMFSYPSYDINFEVDQIFQFHNQEFQRMVIKELFNKNEE